MRIRVLVHLFAEQCSVLAQVFYHLLVRIKDILAGPYGHTDFLSETPMLIDRRKDRQTVFNTGSVIIGTMSGRDMNLTGAGVEGHEFGKNHSGFSIQEWMLSFDVLELCATKKTEIPVRS